MDINLQTNKDTYFRQLLAVLSLFYPYNKLSKKELNIFADLLKVNYMNRDKNDEEKAEILLGKEARKELALRHSISNFSLNNYIFGFRSKGFLDGGNIAKQFSLSPINNINIKFKP